MGNIATPMETPPAKKDGVSCSISEPGPGQKVIVFPLFVTNNEHLRPVLHIVKDVNLSDIYIEFTQQTRGRSVCNIISHVLATAFAPGDDKNAVHEIKDLVYKELGAKINTNESGISKLKRVIHNLSLYPRESVGKEVAAHHDEEENRQHKTRILGVKQINVSQDSVSYAIVIHASSKEFQSYIELIVKQVALSEEGKETLFSDYVEQTVSRLEDKKDITTVDASAEFVTRNDDLILIKTAVSAYNEFLDELKKDNVIATQQLQKKITDAFTPVDPVPASTIRSTRIWAKKLLEDAREFAESSRGKKSAKLLGGLSAAAGIGTLLWKKRDEIKTGLSSLFGSADKIGFIRGEIQEVLPRLADIKKYLEKCKSKDGSKKVRILETVDDIMKRLARIEGRTEDSEAESSGEMFIT